MNHDRTRILTALHNLLPDASVTESQGSFFWFAAGDEKKRLPFPTLVTRDEYDVASRLSRPGVYRLNVPLSPRQYRERFGSPPAPQAAWQVLDTALNVLTPHPLYAPMHWVCILNPGQESCQSIGPLLKEAHFRADKREKR